MGELTVQRFPWEPEPQPVRTVEETVRALQQDFAYAVKMTAVVVRSNNPAFAAVVNTDRGQIIPRGECKFSDGTTVELQDIGMCQPDTPYMSVQEVMARVWELATELGLELVK